MDTIKKYLEIFKSCNEWQCICILLLASYLVLLPLSGLAYFFPVFELGEHPTIKRTESLPIMLLVAAFIVPLLETLLFQWLPAKVLYKMFEVRLVFVCLISAIIFAALHPYSIGYVILTFFIGLLFMTAYLLLSETTKKPFKIIFLTHGFRNAIAVFAMFYDV